MRERIVTAKDQGASIASAPPLTPAFTPAPFHRSHYYRDPASRTFHIFTVGDATAVCGVSRMAKGRMRGWTNLTCPGQRICRACLRGRSAAAGKVPRQGMPRDKIVLKIDQAVLAEIDRRVGRDRRVQWIQSAIRAALAWEDKQNKARESGEEGGAS